MLTFSSSVLLRRNERRQADREDGDGDGGLDALPELERDVGRGAREEHAHDRPDDDRADGDLGDLARAGDTTGV